MKEPELKPCPICGRRPIIERWYSNGLMHMVKCNSPDCPIPSCSYPTGRNLEEVKEEWNRRTSDEAQQIKRTPESAESK